MKPSDYHEALSEVERLQRENVAVRQCIARAETGIEPREDTADWLAQVLQVLVCNEGAIKQLEAKLAAAEATLTDLRE